MTRRDGICKTEKSLYMTSRLPHERQVERPPMRTHAHAHTYTHVSTTCPSASQLQKLLETPHTPRPELSCVHSAPLAPPFLGPAPGQTLEHPVQIYNPSTTRPWKPWQAARRYPQSCACPPFAGYSYVLWNPQCTPLSPHSDFLGKASLWVWGYLFLKSFIKYNLLDVALQFKTELSCKDWPSSSR